MILKIIPTNNSVGIEIDKSSDTLGQLKKVNDLSQIENLTLEENVELPETKNFLHMSFNIKIKNDSGFLELNNLNSSDKEEAAKPVAEHWKNPAKFSYLRNNTGRVGF